MERRSGSHASTRVRRRLYWLPIGVLAAANALFALILTRLGPPWLAFTVALFAYLVTVLRFTAQMRDQPRPRWITRLLDEPLFAHFGACVAALLLLPLCGVLALGLTALERGSGGVALHFLHWLRACASYAYAFGLALSVWAIWIERRLVRVRELSVAIHDLPPEFDGYRIAQLSDLHVGSFDPKARALHWVALCNAQQPDLTVVTGDLVTSGSGFYRDVAEAIASLRATDGVFVTMGNHDQTNNDQLTELVRALGPTVLRNASHLLRRGNASLNLVGLAGRVTLADTERLIQSARQHGAPIVLLSHYPWVFETAVRAGADLILTGHTHGGQLGIPFFSQRFNLARLTGQRSRGLVRSGNTAMYVNAGLGTTGPPMRLAVPPEIALITLRRA